MSLRTIAVDQCVGGGGGAVGAAGFYIRVHVPVLVQPVVQHDPRLEAHRADGGGELELQQVAGGEVEEPHRYREDQLDPRSSARARGIAQPVGWQQLITRQDIATVAVDARTQFAGEGEIGVGGVRGCTLGAARPEHRRRAQPCQRG